MGKKKKKKKKANKGKDEALAVDSQPEATNTSSTESSSGAEIQGIKLGDTTLSVYEIIKIIEEDTSPELVGKILSREDGKAIYKKYFG